MIRSGMEQGKFEREEEKERHYFAENGKFEGSMKSVPCVCRTHILPSDITIYKWINHYSITKMSRLSGLN